MTANGLPAAPPPGGTDIRADWTVAEFVVRYPAMRENLEQLGIDYCCGGRKLLGAAVADAGRDWAAVLDSLKAAMEQGTEGRDVVDWNAAPLEVLADHILEKHHVFTKAQLLRIAGLLAKVQNAHGAHHGDMLERLQGVYGALHLELDSHLMKEERILFPAIKSIAAFVAGASDRPEIHCGSIGHPIGQMEHEHEGAGQALAGMRRITGGYNLPADACPTFGALFDALQALEADLHEHIHLENNILFPRSLAREREMNGA